MHGLKRIRIKEFQRDARHAEHVNLAEKLAEIDTALVVYRKVGIQPDGKTGQPDSGAHVDVLGKHLSKASYRLIYPTRKAHIEGARREFLKPDLAAADALEKAYADSTIPLIRLDYDTGEGLDQIRARIAGNLCAFCGNSGVGKSTLLNALAPQLERQTGGISQKLGRGRHTTREVEIFEVCGGLLADTPGFASLDANKICRIPPEELQHAFPEFEPYFGQCRFTGCSHRSEKGCAVRAALEEGKLSDTRYQSYLTMYEEASQLKEWER